MNLITSKLIEKIEEDVYHLLDNFLPQGCLFHTKKHTSEVLRYSRLIADYLKLNKEEQKLISISALFHDIGYISTYEGHEHKSADYARDYLSSRHIDKSSIKIIVDAIMSTKVPQLPENILDKILCDADLAQLTFENYFENMEFLRLEWINMGIVSFNEKEFHMNSIKFFNSHSYHTEYGRLVLQPKKEVNLNRIKQRINEL